MVPFAILAGHKRKQLKYFNEPWTSPVQIFFTKSPFFKSFRGIKKKNDLTDIEGISLEPLDFLKV